jgi:hypothetical protein
MSGPHSEPVHGGNICGIAYFKQGNEDTRDYSKAIELNPDYMKAQE